MKRRKCDDYVDGDKLGEVSVIMGDDEDYYNDGFVVDNGLFIFNENLDFRFR